MSRNDPIIALARDIYLSGRGSFTDGMVVAELTRRGFTPPVRTVGQWRRDGQWHLLLTPETTSAVLKSVRGREIADLISRKGGEIVLLDGVYGSMILAASETVEKLLAWARTLDPKKLKPDDALAMMKAIPPMVDKAIVLKDRISELRFKGASLSLTDQGDPAALNGEIIAPDPKQAAIVSVPKQSDVQPALADALANLAKAKKAAPAIVRDVAPRQRTALKRG